MDPSGGKDFNRVKLIDHRQQTQAESLEVESAAEDIRRLMYQVYPDMPEKSRGRMGHDQ